MGAPSGETFLTESKKHNQIADVEIKDQINPQKIHYYQQFPTSYFWLIK